MFGHPLHPALVHFPIGLLLSATLGDAAWAIGLTANVQVAAVMMAAGLAAGLLAMGAGLIDFARLDEAVVPHALRHMSVVGLAWTGYAIALYLRRDVLFGSSSVTMSAVACSCVSAMLLGFGAWLGGRLVYTLGAGVGGYQKRL